MDFKSIVSAVGLHSHIWWARMELHHRCFSVADLQSAPFATTVTDPYWCLRLDLNQRQPDFQSGALTELSYRGI